MNYSILGYISLFLLVVVTAPYWLRTINNKTVKTKSKGFMNFLKFLRSIHKQAGILLAAIALIHGYMALRLSLHTGLIAFLIILVTASLGIYHWRKKNIKVFKAHKAFALLSVLLVAIHFFWPGALRLILG